MACISAPVSYTHLPFAPDDAARRDAALELLESLDLARPTGLVVDDVHLLASAPSCVRFFQILARQAMSNLHIVLTTRHFQTDDALPVSYTHLAVYKRQ